MLTNFYALLKKDFRLIVYSKFFLVAIGSLVLYSCYINFIYINLDQDIYPVYIFDPNGMQERISTLLKSTNSLEELQNLSRDGYSMGLNLSSDVPQVIMVTSGIESMDNHRVAYALSLLTDCPTEPVVTIGNYDKESKNRREITCEFLFFELVAVGFLGLSSMLFKEKQMGVVRVHGVLPVNQVLFIISKLSLLLANDLLFAILLTLINLGLPQGITVLPIILLQSGILSLIMSLIGFLCAIRLKNFKQFSLFYLVFTIFVITPVFLVGQTGLEWNWIKFNPIYHLFMAMKNAYFMSVSESAVYYISCIFGIIVLFLLALGELRREITKEA